MVLAGVTACRPATARDQVTLTLDNRADYVEARLEERALTGFRQTHPEMTVVQQSAGTGPAEYRERILTSLAAGTPPDVFLFDDIDVPAFLDRRAVLDLTPFLPRMGVDLARYDSTVLSIFRRGSAVYALPKGYTPLVVAYNKDLFDRAGLVYPTDDWTWDDFSRVARVLTRDTDGDGRVDVWGTSYDRRVVVWLPWIWSGGGDVLCPDGNSASGCLDSPTSIAALRWYTGWVTLDRIAARAFGPRRALGDDLRLFASGRVAMLTAGHSWVPTLRPYVAQHRLRVGFAAIPHRAGFPPATVIYASGFAVPVGAPHRRPSVELAAMLADSATQSLRAAAGLELPSVTGAAVALAARDTLGWEVEFLRASAHARAPWGARVAEWRAVEALLPDLMDQITIAGVDPAVAAHAMAKRLDRLLAVSQP